MANTLLIYGSLTGNTETLSHKIQEMLTAKGKEIDIKNAADSEATDLTGPHTTYILASSTWDDGLTTADFGDFIERLKASNPSLAGKKIAIVALGDSNYVHFCGAADVMEGYFVNQLGGQKIVESLRIDGYPEMEENQNLVNNWVEKLATLID